MSVREVRVPELGDFSDVDVIEIYVKAGDHLEVEQPLIGLETDKAAMDVPAPYAGEVRSVVVRSGDKVSHGDLILTMEVSDVDAAASPEPEERSAAPPDPDGPGAARGSGAAQPAAPARRTSARPLSGGTVPGPDLVVLGSGPGGYTAAFRAADLGLNVTLVERYAALGGVCLNVGCIPSKALLHAARVVEEAREVGEFGIDFGRPKIDTAKLRAWKDRVVRQMTQGLDGLARRRKVTVIQGYGRFSSPNTLTVERDGDRHELRFDQCIIAAGSAPVRLPGQADDPRIMDSTSALELADLPERLLVVGGGIIGLELATVYEALGVDVSVVELTEILMPGCDRDLVAPLQKRIKARYGAIMLGTGVAAMEAGRDGIEVTYAGKQAPQTYGRVLVAVGRRPNGSMLDAEAAGIVVDGRGFIAVDRQMRTDVAHIFAIGDIVGPPMLAHKASHEGKVAAEVASGMPSYFDARVVPSVAYTDPEVAWVGLREEEAKENGTPYEKGVFPWVASGRSLSLGRSEGMTKLLFEPGAGRLLGAGIVGTNAGDLIAEAALAIELGCDARDIGLTIHPHPTLSETVAFAAEVAEGTATDLFAPKA